MVSVIFNVVIVSFCQSLSDETKDTQSLYLFCDHLLIIKVSIPKEFN